MDVKAALHSTISNTANFTIAEFTTWPLLIEFTLSQGLTSGATIVKPDGFIRIHEGEEDGGLSEHTFFLEVDRSTETLDTLVAKAVCYLDYYRSGGFAVRNGASREAYKDFPFRVLMVFKTPERRNNVAERLLLSDRPILSQVYLTTFKEATTDPLGPIWIRPIDYRTATGLTLTSEKRFPTPAYKRQTARDELVERNVRKVRLLDDESE